MSLELFFKLLSKMTYQYDEWIVKLAYRHNENESYTITNEVLNYSLDGDTFWLDDWNEGEDDVIVLGAVPIDIIKIKGFTDDFIMELHRQGDYSIMEIIAKTIKMVEQQEAYYDKQRTHTVKATH